MKLYQQKIWEVKYNVNIFLKVLFSHIGNCIRTWFGCTSSFVYRLLGNRAFVFVIKDKILIMNVNYQMSEYLKRSDVINALKTSELLVGDNLAWAIEIVTSVPTVKIKTEEGENK